MRPHEVLVALAMTAAACTADATPPAATSAPPSSPTETTESVSFGSARGPLIAFHSDPGGRDDTYVMTPDGRGPVAVTDGLETVAEPLWSPDGTRLVVECCTGVHGRLLLLDGPGADPIELAPDVGEATTPAWSPNGETIAFESLTDNSVYVVDVGGAEPGAPVRLVAGAGPSWSPDGSRLAFFAEVDGTWTSTPWRATAPTSCASRTTPAPTTRRGGHRPATGSRSCPNGAAIRTST